METFHRFLIGFHRFTSIYSFVGLQMILPIHIYIWEVSFVNFVTCMNFVSQSKSLINLNQWLKWQLSFFRDHAQKFIYTFIYLYIYIYTFLYIYTHIYIYIYIWLSSFVNRVICVNHVNHTTTIDHFNQQLRLIS